MRETCALTAAGCAIAFRDGLTGVDLLIPRSFTNFVILIALPLPRRRKARTLSCGRRGFSCGHRAVQALPDCLRATIGVADDMAFAAEVLKDWQRKEGPA